MHLWPSLRIRDSFKRGYLNKLELNINRMNNQKDSPQTNQKLLDDNGGGEISSDTKTPPPRFILVCRELLMLLSCCYCCFCCGACVEQEEN